MRVTRFPIVILRNSSQRLAPLEKLHDFRLNALNIPSHVHGCRESQLLVDVFYFSTSRQLEAFLHCTLSSHYIWKKT